MDNSLLAVRGINHKYIVVDGGFYVMQIDADISNNTNNNVTFSSITDSSVYLDNYQYNIDDPYAYVSSLYGNTYFDINDGRRGKGTFYASVIIEDADNSSMIEMEVVDSNFTVLFKNDGQWLYGDQASTTSTVATTGENISIYGTYSLSPNEVGGHSEASIAFYTDGSGDYVAITSYDNEGEVSYDYSGSLQKDGDSYIATDKYDVSYRITFTDSGMNIEKFTGDPDDYDKEFIGLYQLIEKLNLNEVG